MIEYLYIKNATIIEELEIKFFEGLNILSGETGAGKSIIIDSIGFIMGSKTSKNFIRRGEDSALVEVLIHITSDDVIESLKDMGINLGEDNRILISRSLNLNNRSNLRINGKYITLAMLKEISHLLVDIHGQHEHQSLLNPAKHIYLLDRFCGNELDKIKVELSNDIKSYKKTINQITSILSSNTENKLQDLNYSIEEIENANLKQNEEVELQQHKKRLINHKNLALYINKSVELLYGSYNTTGAADKILEATKLISEVSNLDSSKKYLAESLESASIQLDDIVRQLRNSDTTYNPEELEGIEARLDYIYKLKRKYGNTVEEILSYCNKINLERDTISENLKLIDKLKADKKVLQNVIKEKCNKISSLRKKSAEILEKQIEDNLKELGMQNTNFKISIDKKNEFNSSGNDNVEFLISTNMGEPLKALAKIASGGEMSRVMLALKVVLSETDSVNTFIFDEIDTGVSGRTAQKVAEKLAVMSKNKQILCITHLPQIASMGDSHFLIEKIFKNERSLTNISILSRKDIISEISRLIAGTKVTAATIIAAEEMKEMAESLKASSFIKRL